ncbi:exonuclease SbcCD subunit D [Motiliproteus sp. MSK22-1]|uniref:exonuclease SbcCD subunit D n=1 Tax=Motiliproteus sp. MSK22-1 TaxID=1897630 RepID=UPI0009784860|nr:exonuclease SbcCD subunit D [Motiliproteus sp. MSK22-1]OMH38822.1 exonuclease sbcCD subunit D [Motiliproteus sp. MSK22-1]
MRLLHTSDWHIGRQFHNVSLLEDQRHVLSQIVKIIAEREVDVLLVAGDVYDRSVPPAAAVALLDDVLDQICRELGVPVIMIAGNHDSPERLGFGARQLLGAGLHIIGPLEQMLTPVVIQTETSSPVVFYGIPYADPAMVRDCFAVEVSTHDQAMAFLCEQVDQHHKNSDYAHSPCVLLSHCFIDGGESCESERPLSIGGADRVSARHFKTFNYTALGHLHGRQFKGSESIRYSGSILKYSFSEQHQHKSVVLVDINEQGQSEIEQVSLTPLKDMRVIEGELTELLAAGENDPEREDYLLVRLTDKHAILDVMGKLRKVFPNVLHLERPGLMAEGTLTAVRKDQLKKGELSMFKDFFQQVSGDPLDPQQSEMVEQVLESIHQQQLKSDGDNV